MIDLNTVANFASPALTVIIGGATLAERFIRRRIQRALKDVQDRLDTAESSLVVMKRRHTSILIYARRLYDMMNRAQMNPPEPPEAFFEN